MNLASHEFIICFQKALFDLATATNGSSSHFNTKELTLWLEAEAVFSFFFLLAYTRDSNKYFRGRFETSFNSCHYDTDKDTGKANDFSPGQRMTTPNGTKM